MVSAYRGNEKIAVDKPVLTRVADEIPPASHRISFVPSLKTSTVAHVLLFPSGMETKTGGKSFVSQSGETMSFLIQY